MIEFMDYIVHAFGASTDWNPDNSYSSLTATSDALLSFNTPSTLALHVSSLSSRNFASSYTLSTLGQIDGSLSYLYTTVPLGHIPSQTPSIPLRHLVRGYRDIRLPTYSKGKSKASTGTGEKSRKPTLLHATLALPPPSVLTALYARRINPETLLSLSLYSKSVTGPSLNSRTPPASCLAHIQHDTGQYSIEGLASTDSALLGVRGLWNFGISPPEDSHSPSSSSPRIEPRDGFIEFPSGLPLPSNIDSQSAYQNRLASKPSLVSAGAEFYYSPFSHVIGLSTGLRFTTLAPNITASPMPPQTSSQPTPNPATNKPLAGTSSALLSTASHSLLTPSNIPHSSFPYTMTLTLTPLTGSISSSYSVRPTPNLALSSRFDFNFYSWESRYVVGGELWRPRRKTTTDPEDPIAWARLKTADFFTPAERALKEQRLQREEENVLKFRVDDSGVVRALWTSRVKSLLVSAGVSVSPVVKNGLGVVLASGNGASDLDAGPIKRWSGTVGVSIAYST
ncbi:hypothetical protein LTR84_006918 [Exophiala bonariae]|uniref:Mitochondrial distribution and morphology protein 10 n=1 Tax=Exophiala bonariae TaxID=1690606 RepID=A0AAV9N0A7_9EURO|nr:hypothetical protein LTR84_006918 [Exophiala bonariae]